MKATVCRIIHPVQAGVEAEQHLAEGGGLDKVGAGTGEEARDGLELGEGVKGGGYGGEEGGEVI